jgi:hypothetical protein
LKKQSKKKKKGGSGSPVHAQGGGAPAVADVANAKEEGEKEPMRTGYHEAHKFMTTYVLIASPRLISMC